ncbi:MAG: glycosyltransferase family 4 protein [Dehalococcoidia bacterium]
MKIALVSAYDIAVPGGVNAHVTHLAEGFRLRGHSVRIIAPGPRALRVPGTITLGRAFPFPSGGSLARVTISPWLVFHVKRLLARERFDVVHVHEPLISMLTLLFLRYSEALTVGTFHAAREGGRSRGYALTAPLLRPWAKYLDGRIAVSTAAARLASRYFPGRYEIIPNGVDVERFATPVPRPATPVGEQQPYILFVGRLEERKGLPTLIEAFALLKRNHPTLRLVVVGDGGRRAGYEQWVKDHGLGDVHFAGRASASDLAGYYQHAAVYCAPNTGNESFGIVLLEAMAAGCPVVATDIEGFASVITDGDDGLLVPPRNPGAMADALARVLDDPVVAQRLITNGRRCVVQYDWPAVTERVLTYYRCLLGENHTTRISTASGDVAQAGFGDGGQG